MQNLVCDLCGKDHAVQHCKSFDNQEKSSELNLQTQVSLPYQTIPNWIYFHEVHKKLIACKEIEKSYRIGPFLAPQSSTLNNDIEFPLQVQISQSLKLWIDQSDENKCNWLTLIPASPFNYNLVACQIDECIYYIAVKNIKIGQELRVWYAPFYKDKICSDVLERVILSYIKKERVTLEIEEKSTSNLTVRNEIEDTDNLFTTPASSILGENNFLNSFVPHSLCNDSSTTQIVRVGSAPKTLSSISLPSSSVTPSLSAFTQSVFLVPSSFTNSLNLDSSVYGYPTSLSINAKVSDAIPDSSQSVPLRLPNGIDDLENPSPYQLRDSALTNENVTFQVLNLQPIPVEATEQAVNPFASKNEPQLWKHLNLSSLQGIAISQGKITFTHQFPRKENNTSTSSEFTTASNSKTSGGNLHNKTIVVSSKNEKSNSQSTFQNPEEASTICLSEKNEMEDLKECYEMVSLSVLKDASDALVSKIVSKQKHEKVIQTKECSPKDPKSSPVSSTSNLTPPDHLHWVCIQCGDSFQETFLLALHLKNHVLVHLGRRFVCEVCAYQFKKSEHLNIHMMSHPKKHRNDGTDKSSVLKSLPHTNSKDTIRSKTDSKSWLGCFHCQICQKRFANGKYLLRHLAKHSGEFACSLCQKEFARNENLRKHLCVQRVDKNRLKCNVCKKIFSSFHACKLHSLQHDESVRCKHCSRLFPLSAFECHEAECAKVGGQHIQDVSREKASDENSRLACPTCARNFTSQFFLKNHAALCKQQADVSENGEVNCGVCGSLCAGPSQLRSHLQTHTHPYLCLNCSQRFRSRGTYETHICGVEFLCDLCSCAVRSLQELFKHMTPHGPSPFCCARCRHPFYHEESLKLHHCPVEVRLPPPSSEKVRVRCPFCPSLFAEKHNLKKHMASLHGVPLKQKFECGKCGKTFHRSDLLKSHEKVHLAPSLQCLECNKRFKSHRSFENHSALHRRDFRFNCRFCDKGFAQKKDILRHEKTHKESTCGSNPAPQQQQQQEEEQPSLPELPSCTEGAEACLSPQENPQGGPSVSSSSTTQS